MRDGTDRDLVIEVSGLRMRYGEVDVLDGIDFAAKRGEVLLLLGPNGARKTTTVGILEGFRVRSAGDVKVLGVDPAAGDEAWRARIGMMLQSWRDHGKWRVRDLLRRLAQYYLPYATPNTGRPADPDRLIEPVGLAAQANQKVAKLSGGLRPAGPARLPRTDSAVVGP